MYMQELVLDASVGEGGVYLPNHPSLFTESHDFIQFTRETKESGRGRGGGGKEYPPPFPSRSLMFVSCGSVVSVRRGQQRNRLQGTSIISCTGSGSCPLFLDLVGSGKATPRWASARPPARKHSSTKMIQSGHTGPGRHAPSSSPGQQVSPTLFFLPRFARSDGPRSSPTTCVNERAGAAVCRACIASPAHQGGALGPVCPSVAPRAIFL